MKEHRGSGTLRKGSGRFLAAFLTVIMLMTVASVQVPAVKRGVFLTILGSKTTAKTGTRKMGRMTQTAVIRKEADTKTMAQTAQAIVRMVRMQETAMVKAPVTIMAQIPAISARMLPDRMMFLPIMVFGRSMRLRTDIITNTDSRIILQYGSGH